MECKPNFFNYKDALEKVQKSKQENNECKIRQSKVRSTIEEKKIYQWKDLF